MTRGEYWRSNARSTVEEALALDIRELARQGGLLHRFEVRWSKGSYALGGTSVRFEDDELATIFYAANGKPTFEQVKLSWTVPNYGGRRPWWLCPGCERRCAILYHGHARFECRVCSGLTYEMSQLSRCNRAMHQYMKHRRRIGWEYINDPFPAKTPGMHWRTWERRLDGYSRSSRAADEAFAPTLERWEAELRRSQLLLKLAPGLL